MKDKLSILSIFDSDTTLRWSCRKGDIFVWFRWKGMSADPKDAFSIIDLWGIRDGDFVTITNREEDIPGWFELHPTEVCGTLVYEMMEKIENGYEPKDIVDGPNIWRVKAGDRLVWVGKPRPGLKGIDGILSILDFYQNALCLGDNYKNMSFEAMMAFGSLNEGASEQEHVVRCKEALRVIQTLGIPRTWATDWKLG